MKNQSKTKVHPQMLQREGNLPHLKSVRNCFAACSCTEDMIRSREWARHTKNCSEALNWRSQRNQA